LSFLLGHGLNDVLEKQASDRELASKIVDTQNREIQALAKSVNPTFLESKESLLNDLDATITELSTRVLAGGQTAG
jgi:hypothetical protein